MKKNILVGVVVAIIAIGGYAGLQKLSEVKYKAGETTLPEVVSNKIDNDLQKIIDEENFKKATILRARVVANDRKKEAEIARNKQAMALIEAEYETIRQAELELVGGSPISTAKTTTTKSSLK